MSYPGNNSLGADIRQRILTTFDQTLDLAAKGARQEALVGCDFILRLDPLFTPANRLKGLLQSGDGELQVEELRLAKVPPEKNDIFDLGGRGQPAAPENPSAQTEPEAEPEPKSEEDDNEEEGIPGLMSSPADAPPRQRAEPAESPDEEDDELFSDLGADELEAALDLGGLSDAGQATPGPPVEVITDGAEAAEPETVEDAGPETVETAEPEAREAERPEPENAKPAEDFGEMEPDDSSNAMSGGEPTAALDIESEQRIQELLGEGQRAFEGGEYQSAIDAWSRIFLIDIDHDEASRRIELARKLKAEVERQVEEQYHDALALVEAGDFDAARQGFTKVLEMQPSHLAAQEYLEKLDSGTLDAPEASTPAAETPAPSRPAPVPSEPEVSELDGIAGGELEIPAELTIPAIDEPSAPPSRPAEPPAAAKKAPVRRPLLYVGAAVLVAVLAAAWFLSRGLGGGFSGGDAPSPVAPQARVDVIARAQQVHAEGNSALAIAQLKRLPPNHPRYAEAQALIAQWEAPSEEDAAAAEPVSEEILAERDRLVDRARAAFDRAEYLLSHELLTRAASLAALDAEAAQLQTAAAIELQPLRSEIEIFRQGEWGEALRSLWQIRESDPDNPDVRRLMVDSYYNLGVRDLQRRDPVSAATNLREALDLAGDDEEVERVLEFAEAYQQRPVDLLYRIFVKYLPFR